MDSENLRYHYNLNQERPLVQPKNIVGTSGSQCNDTSLLPDEFVTYFSERTRGLRYSRIDADSWDEWIWNGEWIFSDKVNDATALREFQNAEHVAVLIR